MLPKYHQTESEADRWRRHAMHNAMNCDAYTVGAWLIAQMQTDRRHRDYRLEQLMGQGWFERMMRFGINKPRTACRVWRYMIEYRRLPPR